MTAPLSPADVLRQAADYLAIPGNWGRDYFINPVDKCRCAAGAVAWVLAPSDVEGNPSQLASRDKTDLGRHATAILADYLIDHEDADLGEQAVETIAFFNDDQETAEPIVKVMRAAADEWDARKRVAA